MTGHSLRRFTRAKISSMTLVTNGKMEFSVEKCTVINLKAGNQSEKYALTEQAFSRGMKREI